MQILRQRRAQRRLDDHIMNLSDGLEIVIIRPKRTIMVPENEVLSSWQFLKELSGVIALKECQVS